MKIHIVIVLLAAFASAGCPAKTPEAEEPTPVVTDAVDECQPGDPSCEEEPMVEEDEGALDDKDYVEDAPCSGGDDEVPAEGGPEE